MKTKIGLKIILGFAAILFLMLLLAIYAVDVTQTSLKESTGKSAIFLTDEMMKRIEQEIHGYIELLKIYSNNIALRKIVAESNTEFDNYSNREKLIQNREKIWKETNSENPDFINKISNNVISSTLKNKFINFYKKNYGYNVFSELFVTNKYGVNIAQTQKTSDYLQKDEKWWQIAKEKGSFISKVEFDESTEMHVISVGAAIKNEQGNFIGAINGTIASDQIARTAEFTIKKHKTAEITLITDNGDVIYSSQPYEFLEDISNTYFFENIKGESGFFTHEEDGIDKLYSYTKSDNYEDLKELSWILVLEHEESEVLAPAFSLRKKVIIAAAILILAGIIFTLLVSHSISEPLKKLIKGVKKIGEGNLNYKIDIKRKDEIGHLARNFNQMTKDLKKVTASRDLLDKEIEERKKAEKELRDSEKKLQKAQEIANMGNFEWNFQSKKTYWSSELYKIHGRDPEKGVPSYKEYLQHVYPEDREKVKYDVRKAKETGEYLTEYRIKRFDNGEIRYVQTKGRVNYDENSKPLLLEATEQDITKRKKTEKKLAEYREHLEELVDKRTEKLKKAQKELINKERLAAMGELAGGIAHEIKNPLATIDSSAVNLQYQNYEDEKINKHLGKIRDAVKRCVEVIDSLRRLKSKEKPQLETTNLNNFLTNTLDQIKAPEHIKLITKISQKNIFIKSDKAQLRICLKNLVRNSIDAIENEGKINVKLDLANTSKCKITITDNGIGIDKNELDKIFEPLYTSKSTGIGFGLSLVKRTLEVHDGEIKVNSKPGKGTTFEIILPIMESYI